jgi:hypothetical protein
MCTDVEYELRAKFKICPPDYRTKNRPARVPRKPDLNVSYSTEVLVAQYCSTYEYTKYRTRT